MTDAHLMDADCIHGVTWYECDDCQLRDLLIRVDSVCSIVAHRGIDAEARMELVAVSKLARSLYRRQP